MKSIKVAIIKFKITRRSLWVLGATTKENKIEELADILEVIHALIKHL